MNKEDYRNKIIPVIKEMVRAGYDREEILDVLAEAYTILTWNKTNNFNME